MQVTVVLTNFFHTFAGCFDAQHEFEVSLNFANNLFCAKTTGNTNDGDNDEAEGQFCIT
jgi:hypothetical protein